MGKPTYYPEGSEPRRTDTLHRTWSKILGTIQDRAGANPANDPDRDDSLWRLKEKINKALTE